MRQIRSYLFILAKFRKDMFLVIMCSIFSFSLSAQWKDSGEDLTNVTANYQFIKPVRVIRCLNLDGIATTDTVEVKAGKKFKIIDILSDGSAIIELWPSDADSLRRGYFKVRTNDFHNKTKARYATTFVPFNKHNNWFTGTAITGGVTIIPFKFRPSIKIAGEKMGFDFSKDVQLGLTGGIKQRVSHYRPFFINAVLNIGISSVTMNSYNTRGKLTDDVDIAALGVSTGLVFDFKSIQLGAFLGWDKVSDQNKNNWIYQGKPWWSIGFGYSIFSISSREKNDPMGDNSIR